MSAGPGGLLVMNVSLSLSALAMVGTLAAQAPVAPAPAVPPPPTQRAGAARNVILFIGDGMGLSTVTAARIHSVGVSGQLTIDQFPFTALSRTYAGDYITPDSASTMSSMMSGRKGNMGVIAMDETTERLDFNRDGDGASVQTLVELAKAAGMKVGIVTTDSITGATPAACFAHINERGRTLEIVLQALPSDPSYNTALGAGVDLIFGGGRGYCVPDSIVDEEGEPGLRPDGRDLRAEFQQAGYAYVWNRGQLYGSPTPQLPLLGLFDQGPMDFEHDRRLDVGSNPSLSGMVLAAMTLLGADPAGYLLVVEGARIDHAHHINNAWRAIQETEELDKAVGVAVLNSDLANTLVVVTADHSHVFHIGGYPMRPLDELPYKMSSPPAVDYVYGPPGDLFSVVFSVDPVSQRGRPALDAFGHPYTALGYANGPGFRVGGRVDPFFDQTRGYGGAPVSGPTDPNYIQEAGIPLAFETHAGEDVGLYAIGPGSSAVKGVVDNTFVFGLVRTALGL